MACSSEITIGGHEFDVMRYSYTVWEHFKPEDRVIRTSLHISRDGGTPRKVVYGQ